MPPPRIGFVGFGEVASVFSAAIRARGAEISVYDTNLSRPDGETRLRQKVRAEGIRFQPLAEVVEGSTLVISTVRARTAVAAAQACAKHLRAGKTFVDLNSTSPGVKREIGAVIEPTGALFVEGVILGAVGASGAATRILIGGEHGCAVAEDLGRLGLKASYYGPEIGKASVFKMLRNIFSKGVEALLLEMLLAGRKAGIEKELWDDIRAFMTENPFEKVAVNWLTTHPAAAARRAAEMEDVLGTMQEIGAEFPMAAATEAVLRGCSALGIRDEFPEKPGEIWPVIEALARRSRK